MGKSSGSSGLFKGISWGVTGLIVVSLLGVTLWKVFPSAAVVAVQPTQTRAELPATLAPISTDAPAAQAIVRRVSLTTDITSVPNFDVVDYTVQSGDSVFSIAQSYNIKPETLLWANYDVLQDSPDSLRVGQVLKVPPTDGVYYQWKDKDTLDSVAKMFSANVDDIVNWPGNNIDLTNPVIKTGTYVMVPGGQRALVQWIVPSMAVGQSGTSNVGQSTCNGGPVGTISNWPTINHYLSGYDFSPIHQAIDIAAGLGAPIFAAGTGVVTLALVGGYNGGYGNVITIDHGNGYVTLYAHLSAVLVKTCQAVYAGQQIGRAGATGNATGPHLHFEVRFEGGFVDPWFVLPK
ncbi:MAG: M23 family metallopeptidase [Anaerolineales bacterium]|jgi:murein DD-endopeptidase MepM/ murein hydrolase activator NlpD